MMLTACAPVAVRRNCAFVIGPLAKILRQSLAYDIKLIEVPFMDWR